MPKILIADDMAVFREPIAAALQRQGYQTVCAADGVEAVSTAEREKPDLVLLDVSMPNMSGIEALRRLRSLGHLKSLPVIMLTDEANKDLIVEAGKLKISGWVLKSNFSLSDLLTRITEALPHSATNVGVSMSQTASPESAAAVGGETPEAAASAASAPPAIDQTGQSFDGDCLKDLKPVMRRSEVQDALDHCGELKGMSPTVAQVLKMSRQKNCSIEAVAKAIKQDHAVSLKILKLANSTVYTRGEPVDTVQKAVMRIGLSQIHQTVMNISVVEKFSGIEEDERLNSPQFWEHSIATGLIAAEITRKLGGKEEEIDSAFTMGLLHDVGRMVYAEMFGDKYLQVLDVADRLQLPLEQVESRLMLINHAEAMDRVLHAWHFPKALINPIAFHHLSIGNIRRMSPRSLQEVATLALANRLAHALLLGSSGNLAVYPIEEFLTALKLDGNFVRQIEEEIPDHTADIKFAMLARGDAKAWPEMAGAMRERLTGAFRPIFISVQPDLDALGIVCRRLTIPPGQDESPTIAVVHLTQARDCVPLTAQLKQAEAEAGVHQLPLVTVSPKGDLLLEDRAMAGRVHQIRPYPLTLSDLIGTVNSLLSIAASDAAA